MYIYLGTLKEGRKYDKALRSSLENENITVVRYLKKLKILIIRSEKEIIADDLPWFEILEPERRDFTL